MLNEIKIKYFLVLSELLNFSAAAKALHITQQALSKQISQLEQELDCVLFTRVPRGVELTEAGAVMQKAFHSIQRGMELAMVEIHNNERSNGRVLNIGCAAGLRPGPFLNPLCREFSKETGAQIWFGQLDTFSAVHRRFRRGFSGIGGHPPVPNALLLFRQQGSSPCICQCPAA